jgi:hypothetical protein
MRCIAGVAKVVTMKKSWCYESMYECLSEVSRVIMPKL